MGRIMVRYKVKAERVEENERHVEAVFAQLDREKPAGIRYATFKLADGQSFMHIASVETADASNPLLALDAFRRFVGTVKDRCEEPPVTTELTEIGAYGVFAK